jgi:hypothetical protein
MRWSALVDEVATRTPADRDRVVDLLRVASILVVVAGHWLLAVVTVVDGRIVGDNLLVIVPATQWLTWGLQVMPVFFFVGGRVNGVGWATAQARGSSTAAWIRRRADRLLRPVLVLVAVWTVLLLVLAELEVAPDLLRLGSQIVLTPVWFLAVYLGIVALVPITYAAHRRWPLGTVMGFVLAAIVVDAAHRAGVPAVGWANYVFVWGGVHQLGYLWGTGASVPHGRVWRSRWQVWPASCWSPRCSVTRGRWWGSLVRSRPTTPHRRSRCCCWPGCRPAGWSPRTPRSRGGWRVRWRGRS